jgi:hypothetical protein
MQNKQTSKQTYALGGIRTRENTLKAYEPGVKQIYTAEFSVDKLVVSVKHLRTASYPVGAILYALWCLSFNYIVSVNYGYIATDERVICE